MIFLHGPLVNARMVGERAMARFCAVVAEALEQGLTTAEALYIGSWASKSNPPLQFAAKLAEKGADRGEHLAQAMRRGPDAFSPSFCDLVEAGEDLGHPSDVFRFTERIHDIRRRAGRAMGKVVLILLFMIPLVAMPTLVLYGLDSLPMFRCPDALVAGPLLAVGGFAAAVGLAAAVSLLTPFAYVMPYVGRLRRARDLALVCESMALCSASRLSASRGLEFAYTMNLPGAMRRRLLAVRERVLNGAPLGAALSADRFFPPALAFAVRRSRRHRDRAEVLRAFASQFAHETDLRAGHAQAHLANLALAAAAFVASCALVRVAGAAIPPAAILAGLVAMAVGAAALAVVRARRVERALAIEQVGLLMELGAERAVAQAAADRKGLSARFGSLQAATAALRERTSGPGPAACLLLGTLGFGIAFAAGLAGLVCIALRDPDGPGRTIAQLADTVVAGSLAAIAVVWIRVLIALARSAPSPSPRPGPADFTAALADGIASGASPERAAMDAPGDVPEREPVFLWFLEHGHRAGRLAPALSSAASYLRARETQVEALLRFACVPEVAAVPLVLLSWIVLME